MRKYIKQDILNIIETLKKAAGKLKALIQISDATLLQEFLTECQGAAISVGNTIEESEGEGTAVIPVLEEYCELLYQVLISGDAHTKELEDCLRRAEDEIVKLPERLEVVFLPYKASMWDSLESVWMAARDDENCDAYVVPIPYFDRNPDGTFRNMYYEGEQYPSYVPITRYDKYDFAKRYPDVIFIHSPYDGWNHVTSIHPSFYSEKLKHYTRKLVYIPYYVTGGRINKMHSILPAYFNVDHIILQHESQKEAFAGEFLEKISVFGSPKFDKVINYKITDDMIPESWKAKLRDVVLFLNTGIDGILKNGEKSLLKIQYIIEIVKDENATLLWRPHPLLESTIQSMRPELWQLYLETIDKFRKLENGIWDCTETAELAIKISDVYIGEPTSSISHMFGVLGKPLFFVRQSILKEHNIIGDVKISCCVDDETDKDILWAVVANRNGLMKISLEDGIKEYYIIPNELDNSNLYSDILNVDNKLYLIPRNAKEVAIYDIISNRFEKVALNKPVQKEKFNRGYYYNGKVYLIPRLYPELVILTCSDKTLYYDENIVKEMKKLTGIQDILVSANGSCICDSSILLAAPNKPYVLNYNLLLQKISVNRIQGTKNGFCCMEIIGDKVILGSMENCELTIWDYRSGTCKIITQFPEGWNTQEEICFWDIIEIKGNAYIFPRKNSMILKLSMSNLLLEPLKEEFPFSIENRQGAFYNHPNHFLMVKKLLNGKVIVQDANRHGLSEFLEEGIFDWTPITLTENDELKAFAQNFSRKGDNLPWGMYETKHYSVRRLISYVRSNIHNKVEQKKAFSGVAENLDGTAGKKIYTFISASGGERK